MVTTVKWKLISAMQIFPVLIATFPSAVPLKFEDPHPSITASNYLDFYFRDKLAKNTNAVISSFGIFTALAVISRATGGATKAELEYAVYLDDRTIQDLLNERQHAKKRKRSSETLEIDNAVFVQKDFKLNQNYANDVRKNFGAEIRNVDFKEEEKTRNIINGFISKATHGLLPDFLKQPLNPATVLQLINTIYFKAKWQNPFSNQSTESRLFKGTKNRQVPFMFKDSIFLYADDSKINAQVLQLPYKGNFAMYVFLPRSQDLGQLYELSRKLSPEILEKVILSLRRTPVMVTLPKYTIDSEFKDLKQSLVARGLKTLFSSTANISGLSDQTGLQVSNVQHRGKIIVDEDGTEAAAVTSIEVVENSLSSNQQYFTADHPFFFMIRDDSNKRVFFSGFVVDP